MSIHANQIVEDFKEIKPSFERATKLLCERVQEALNAARIPYFDIEYRTKTIESLDGKLHSKKATHYQQLIDITDLSGVCVVVYFEDDIKPLLALLESSFTGLTNDDFVDKLSISEASKFGYRALHLTVSLAENLASLAPDDLDALAGYKGEIQIRTGFMHVWAKIEHKYNYKAKSASAEVRRSFARLASLVELSDQELDKIHQWFLQNQDTLISETTVSSAISSGENQIILNTMIHGGYNAKNLGASELEIENTLSLIRGAGFSDIRSVKEQLLTHQHQIITAMRIFFSTDSEIRPQDPLNFLAFNEVRAQHKMSGLVKLVEQTMRFDDNISMLNYCRELYTSFNNF